MLKFYYQTTLKALFSCVLFLLPVSFVLGQRVWIEPANATANDEIKIYFDKQGSSFFDDNPTRVFIHAGAAATGQCATDWTYGNGAWGDFSAKKQMTREGKYWVKTLTPRTYFNIPQQANAFRIQMLFRNEYDTNHPNNKEDRNGQNFFVDLVVPGQSMVEVVPMNPKADEQVTITFRAARSTDQALVGASKVYMHSAAVLGKNAERWDRTVGNWGQDDGIGQMTNVGTDVWQMTLTPQAYYNLTDPNENIFKLAMVFRSADGSKIQKHACSGADIFYHITSGFYLDVTSPNQNNYLVGQNSNFTIAANTPEQANYTVTLGGSQIHAASNTTNISFSHSLSTIGSRSLEVTAVNGQGVTKTKTFTIDVFSPVGVIDLPSGLRHGINYDKNDPTKVILALHLPTQTKEVVHVIGDFNNWQVSEPYKLNRTTDGSTWWIELTGLTPKKEYVYQYLIDGNIRIGDPYADKVSDPDDRWISEETYPGLIPYPEGKTFGRATVFQTDQDEYVWQSNDFVRPAPNKLNIYELHIRDFHPDHTFTAVIDELDYLQGLGINCIGLMPINEFEGNSSWGYNPNYYFAVDKYYGHKNELKRLIDECHKRGIAVLNDIVLNHSWHSSPMAMAYWDEANNKPAANNPWYNADHNFAIPDAHWGAPFNHDSHHTRAFIDSVNNYWMTEYRFDGFRFDFTKGFSNNWKDYPDVWGSWYDADRVFNLTRMADAIWERHPGSFVIFEHLADQPEEKALADRGILMWGGHGVTGLYEETPLGWNNVNLYRALRQSLDFNFDNLMSYMESHDEERVAYKIKTYGRNFIKNSLEEQMNRLKLNAVFNLLIPGPRMIWQFGEIGYDVHINYNGRTGEKPYLKEEYFAMEERKSLYDTYSLLFNLRNQHEVFHHLVGHSLDGWAKRMHFSHNGIDVIVIGNFQAWHEIDQHTHSPFIDINPALPYAGDWYELVSNEKRTLTSTNSYRLNAGEFRIYSSAPLNGENEPVENESFTVYFQRPSNWGTGTPKIHHWGAQPAGSLADTSWPGIDMEADGNGWFKYTFSNISATNLLFHNNNGLQTMDLTRDKDGWYASGQWYDADPRNTSSTGLTIHFRTDWNNPHMHIWNVEPAGVAANTTWPGAAMVAQGNGWYKYTIDDATCTNLVFSNNGSPQTGDYYRCGEGWYMNGTWYDSFPEGSQSIVMQNESNNKSFVTQLNQNAPNPCDQSTNIGFSLMEKSYTQLMVYNMMGNLVGILVDQELSPGHHNKSMDVSSLPDGIYVYRLTTNGKVFTKKMVIKK
jgi:1,4-alpha-glucan branching enzyme